MNIRIEYNHSITFMKNRNHPHTHSDTKKHNTAHNTRAMHPTPHAHTIHYTTQHKRTQTTAHDAEYETIVSKKIEIKSFAQNVQTPHRCKKRSPQRGIVRRPWKKQTCLQTTVVLSSMAEHAPLVHPGFPLEVETAIITSDHSGICCGRNAHTTGRTIERDQMDTSSCQCRTFATFVSRERSPTMVDILHSISTTIFATTVPVMLPHQLVAACVRTTQMDITYSNRLAAQQARSQNHGRLHGGTCKRWNEDWKIRTTSTYGDDQQTHPTWRTNLQKNEKNRHEKNETRLPHQHDQADVRKETQKPSKTCHGIQTN